MALYAFDGTGNDDMADAAFDSNVIEFFNAYNDPEKSQDPDAPRGSLYFKGIGTRARTRLGRAISEGLGIGGHDRVDQALKRLKKNVDAGDTTIDVIGFSRGAALAVSFANRVAKAYKRLSIRFLGVWDVVGQFGVPGRHINAGHDLRCPPNAARCYHAMALDERRLLFPLTRLCGPGSPAGSRLVEVWFRGVHSDVGGGNGNAGLNWISLNWMFESARREGLSIDPAAIAANLVHRTAAQQISDHTVEIGPAREILPMDLVHTSVRLEPGLPGRPHNNPSEGLARIDDAGTITGAAVV
jgi:uncharacterized protein (DUF2235 family)